MNGSRQHVAAEAPGITQVSECKGMGDGGQVREFAPIVIFAYARADHLRRSVASLLANPEASRTDVSFFCDAARDAEHQAGVDAVRAYVESVAGFQSVRRVYRERNLGLAGSVVDGVTRVLGERGQVIVVEDDLELSPHFLRFMNDALHRYRHEPRVASVHGYVYPTHTTLPETFFLQGADCWGWATWSRAWRHFDADGTRLLAALRARRLTRDFDYDGTFPFTWMLDQQVKGQNDSWAVRWHASCYLDGLLTLYPGRSLVKNIGNDASGTHGASSDDFAVKLSTTPVQLGDIPMQPSLEAREAIKHFFAARQSARARLRHWLYALCGR